MHWAFWVPMLGIWALFSWWQITHGGKDGHEDMIRRQNADDQFKVCLTKTPDEVKLRDAIADCWERALAGETF